ncbi:hypothetical protein PGTUg99_018882 [Puccinia graminis f. sp. tritici]|uniref:BZIP domain-containing protein n=1 Tax=Puccinia graminis f. sp. tritici TaxID=56615 RepID=A0A5B0RDI8_PUCGR|nr:hypothetical protein PGTUg99_018882 [Puccinia graminis f. sp. tritici]
MKLADQLFHLNRPANPFPEPVPQQPGNLSLGFIYPHPFSQQHSTEDESNPFPKDSGTDCSKLNPIERSGGGFGHHWDLNRSHAQQIESSHFSPATWGDSGRGETSTSFDGPPTSESAPENRSKPSPVPTHFDSQLNGWVSNAIEPPRARLTEHSPPRAQLSAFTLMRSNEPLLPKTDGQNSSDSTEKDASPEDDKNSYLNDHIMPWNIISASSSHGDTTAAPSVIQRSEERRPKRWKRKMTDRRREQNRAHQRAFRERHRLSLKQKDVLISQLEERLIRSQEAMVERSEQIRSLSARLDVYFPQRGTSSAP